MFRHMEPPPKPSPPRQGEVPVVYRWFGGTGTAGRLAACSLVPVIDSVLLSIEDLLMKTRAILPAVAFLLLTEGAAAGPPLKPAPMDRAELAARVRAELLSSWQA